MTRSIIFAAALMLSCAPAFATDLTACPDPLPDKQVPACVERLVKLMDLQWKLTDLEEKMDKALDQKIDAMALELMKRMKALETSLVGQES